MEKKTYALQLQNVHVGIWRTMESGLTKATAEKHKAKFISQDWAQGFRDLQYKVIEEEK